MEIRIRETGAVMFEGEFRAYLQANNGPSYATLTPEVIEALSIDILLEGPQASPTRYQIAYRDGAQQIGGMWYTKYSVADMDADAIAATDAAEAIRVREAAKAQRTLDVSAIKVTTAAGNTFDGDEVSQGRMARAIIALSTGLAPSVNWVLADNTVIQATPQELTEALVLAGQAQAAIWVI